MRDGVYGSLTHARRRELHKAAGVIFVDDPVLHAEHLDRAGGAEAPRAYLEASKAQAALFRPDQAIALAARGLALAAENRDIVDLALLLGDLQQDAGRGVQSLEAYSRALSASGAEFVPASGSSRMRGGKSPHSPPGRRLCRIGAGRTVGGRGPR